MEDEMLRAISARLFATSAVAEVLLGVAIAQNPALREPLRKILLDANPGSVLSDQAAEWWADVEVKRRQHVEKMLASADALLAADMPPPAPPGPSA